MGSTARNKCSSVHRIETITDVSLRYIICTTFALRMLFYASDLLARKMAADIVTTDLNYWIKHPFEFSDPILKPEYL